MSNALRSRRSLVSAVLASTLCAGAVTTPAHAAAAVQPTVLRDVRPTTTAPSGAAALRWPNRTMDPPARPNPPWWRGVTHMPVDGELTSPFGQRWGRMHEGMDIAAPVGTPVRAIADGIVRRADYQGGYGLTVEITHQDGWSRSAHLSQARVAPGQRVRAGQVIGSVGTTGSSTGPHLHFELRAGGHLRDPARVLPQRTGTTAAA